MREPTSKLSAESYEVEYTVPQEQEGVRLDHFLKQVYRRRSRESLKTAIEDGHIAIERKGGSPLPSRPKPSSPLLGGDKVIVTSRKKPEPEVNFDYKILYEDDVLLVVDKPPMLPVHPSGRFFFNTLLTHLKTRGKETLRISGDEFYLAHRIDKETSGVLALTKTTESCAHVVEQFATRQTKKTYLALVEGSTPQTFSNNRAMNRSTRSKVLLKMDIMPESEGGLPAHTDFKLIKSINGKNDQTYSLIECYPRTGRQHQIRLHLADLGHPILGDKLYGVDEEFALLFYERERLTPEAEAKLKHPRHALHAHRLELIHPKTLKRMEFVSPLSQDIEQLIEKISSGAT